MLPKNRQLSNLLGLITLYTMLWWGCATVVPLTGGPEDEKPPGIDSLKSTPNFQTNFTQKEFELTFDEWVVLKDVFNQVVVSPPLLGGRPEVSLLKKTVKVNLGEEDLRPDATYIINFGEAVADYTKGNVAPDLRFVFSTGDYIDSLELTGSIVDAFTGDPVDKCLFLLYDNLADSVVRKDIPFYFSRTTEGGQFRLQNIKADTFKTFALLSDDPNYKYDKTSEQIGFLDTFVVVTDSTRLNLKLRLFKEQPRLRTTKKENAPFGFTKIVYNQTPHEAVVTTEDVGQEVYQIMEGDSIKLWYNWDSPESWKIYLQQDTLFDTLVVDTMGRYAFLQTARLKTQAPLFAGVQSINPIKGITFSFNRPLLEIDQRKIFLLEDTLKTEVKPLVTIDSLDRRKLNLQYDWGEQLPYELRILPGAIKDIYGLTADTLTQNYVAMAPDDFGVYTIELTDLDSLTQYQMQLLKKEVLIEERTISQVKTMQYVFSGLELGSDYAIRLIEDIIPNGRWDTGSYDEKRQPERVSRFPLQELRANFEAVETIPAKF